MFTLRSSVILGVFLSGSLSCLPATVTPSPVVEKNPKKVLTTKKEGSKPVPAPSKKEKKRSYKISAALRGEFDDNFLNANREIRSRFRTSFEPGVEWKKKWETGDIRARYEFGLSYYENRRSKPVDDFHQSVVSLNQRFWTHGTVFWDSRARKTDEPMLIEGDRRTRRRDSSYFQSGNTLGIRQDWNRNWKQEFSGGMERSLYDDPVNRLNLQRFQYWNFNSLRYSGVKDWIFLTELRGNKVDYDFIRRDNMELTQKTGVEWTFMPKQTVGVKGGPAGFFSNEVEDRLGYEANFFHRGSFDHEVKLETLYSYGTQPSLFSFYTQGYHQFQENIRYSLIDKLTGSAGLRYRISDYEPEKEQGSRLSPYREYIASVDTGFEYEWQEGWSLEIKHNYIFLDSSIPDRDYERNRVSMGVRMWY
jgi:hypothetical protein